jgi:deoxyhypusine synthase
MSQPVSDFIRHHYRHFNAAALVDAADGYSKLVDSGGKMLVSLAGAMSTGELGLSLAEMIRRDKVCIISWRWGCGYCHDNNIKECDFRFRC